MATIEQIKELREKTGAGVDAIKKALDKYEGDLEKAIIYLRQQGVAKAEKRKSKEAKNGVLGTYIHSNNRVVVVVEVNTETDFAARGEELKEFANQVALHVAAMNPQFISVDSIDKTFLEKEKKVFEKELDGKPADVKEKIIDGKLEKLYADVVLTKQKFFSDDSKTIEDLLNELIAKIGEKIEIKQFHKFEVAQDVVACNN